MSRCAKTLDALGWRVTGGRRIVRRMRSLVGQLEGLGATAELRALDAIVAERSGSANPATAS